MNKDIIQGNWQQLKGKVRQQWGDLTDDEVQRLKGTREELGGLIQKKYGYQKDRVERELDNFIKANRLDDKEH
ncbi:CsbD family protein [Candidatus Berkiella aquae]|uniref:CsbD family protein n=1 Tax=Candidatus Berkiella aquae TaxID=295108 RepID=A0A0Q9YY59_9GAMM|nr:CsbD family protein [Candidatus Berkiella aquae]MCS5710384.1 CsbD family protein [Candidatus Berkiella aquae]